MPAETFVEAAHQVLKDAGKPLKTTELWERINAQGLYKSAGKTPHQTLVTELLRNSLGTGATSSRKSKTFYKAGPGTYGLVEWLDTDELATLEQEDSLVRNEKEVTKTGKSDAARSAERRAKRLARRTDPARAEIVFRSNCPDESSLKTCANAFAQVIRAAHRRNPESWQITLGLKRININIGMCLTLNVKAGRVWIAVIEPDLTDLARETLETHSAQKHDRGFKAVPNSGVYFVPTPQLHAVWNPVYPALESFIAKAAMTRTPYAAAHSPGVLDFLRNYLVEELPDPAHVGRPTPAGRGGTFDELFELFVSEYLETEDGEDHLAAYEPARAAGRRNFDKIRVQRDAGEDVTDDVLLGLLPHSNTKGNRKRGAWIHIAPAITKNARTFFEANGWTRPEDWPRVSAAILRFVERSTADPSVLPDESSHFAALEYTKGLQTGMLSPILNALRPDDFTIVNGKSRGAVNYFAGTNFGLKIADYADANRALLELLAKHNDTLVRREQPNVRTSDVFDLFSHWLVGVRKSFNIVGADVEGDDEIDEDEPEVDDGDEVQTDNLNDLQPVYTAERFLEETGYAQEQLDEWMRILMRKRQIVLQGPPGTGKTFVAQRLAKHLVSARDGILETVQFHPSYAYEDFMRGIRPRVEAGGLSYEWEDGRFLQFCASAAEREGRCVLIIDEINRANLSRVFGELMYLLEYRGEEIPLAGGANPFSIPHNVFIIGTMNTADRSIARLDHALRRRFSFIRLRPAYEILRRHLDGLGLPARSLVAVLESVNRLIDDPNYEIGISYFIRKDADLKPHLPDIWRYEIETYLEEFFYDQPGKVADYRWDSIITAKLKDWA